MIQTGDVQWMTAGSGVLHEEVFSEEFRQTGGGFEFLQLWINLPAKDKMNPARYQNLANDTIPKVTLENEAYLRVIAGEYLKQKGPAQTHTPIQVFDVFLEAGQTLVLPAQERDTTLIYLLSGRLQITGAEQLIEAQNMAVMSNQGVNVEVNAIQNTKFLFLSGTPLNEPIYARGYFVMNEFSEILEAYEDLKNNQFIRH